MNFWFITMRLSGTRFWMDKFQGSDYRMVHTKRVYLPLVFQALDSGIPIVTCKRPLEDIQSSYRRRNWDPVIAIPEYEVWKDLIEPNAELVLDTNNPLGDYRLPGGVLLRITSREPIGHGI